MIDLSNEKNISFIYKQTTKDYYLTPTIGILI